MLGSDRYHLQVAGQQIRFNRMPYKASECVILRLQSYISLPMGLPLPSSLLLTVDSGLELLICVST